MKHAASLASVILLLALPPGIAAADEPASPPAAAEPSGPVQPPPVAAAASHAKTPAVEVFPTPMAAPLARICLAIALVSGTGFALAFWSRKRRLGKSGAATRIQVLASRSIGTRHQVVLIEVGGHRLLVGTGGDSIRTLADLTESEAFAATLERELPAAARAPGLHDPIGGFEGLDA